MWAPYDTGAAHGGVRTTNTAESLNSLFLAAREMNIISMVTALLDHEAMQRQDAHNAAVLQLSQQKVFTVDFDQRIAAEAKASRQCSVASR